jgi:hypothetical protein
VGPHFRVDTHPSAAQAEDTESVHVS